MLTPTGPGRQWVCSNNLQLTYKTSLRQVCFSLSLRQLDLQLNLLKGLMFRA